MDARVALATTAGGLATTGVRSTWSRRLDGPASRLPGADLAPVRTALYADIAVTTAVALDRLRGDPPQALATVPSTAIWRRDR